MDLKTEMDVIRELRGISGSGVPYIIKEVIFVLDGERLRGRIAWDLIEEVPMFLGRMDIFNKFRITFDEQNGYVEFERIMENGGEF